MFVIFLKARKVMSPVEFENERASLSGSTEKMQEFSENDKHLDDMFEDDWDHNLEVKLLFQ